MVKRICVKWSFFADPGKAGRKKGNFVFMGIIWAAKPGRYMEWRGGLEIDRGGGTNFMLGGGGKPSNKLPYCITRGYVNIVLMA